MLHFIIQTCCRCSLQTQSRACIHNLNRTILERTNEAVWRRGKCNWDWTATELKAPFFLKIPLLLGRHIYASTWFRKWLRRQAGCKAGYQSPRSVCRAKSCSLSCRLPPLYVSLRSCLGSLPEERMVIEPSLNRLGILLTTYFAITK